MNPRRDEHTKKRHRHRPKAEVHLGRPFSDSKSSRRLGALSHSFEALVQGPLSQKALALLDFWVSVRLHFHFAFAVAQVDFGLEIGVLLFSPR